MHYLDLTHPDDVELDLREAADVMAGRRPSVRFEKRVLRPGGEVRQVEVTVTRTPDGSFGIGLMEDITERKDLEEELRRSQKLEAVGRLAGGIAHEFNNLLTVVGGYARLLLEEGEVPQSARWRIEEIVFASQRAADLIHRLLAYSRQQVLSSDELDLGALVAELEDDMYALLPEGVELAVSAAPGVVVRADRSQLKDVVLDLVLNAGEAVGDHGRVEVRVAADDGSAVLAVADDGPGLTAEVQARAFEPFYTTQPFGAKRGLGLAAAHGIVAQSGGTIEIESAPGEGSEFTVRLPLVRVPAPV
jgi:two-component system, cell cycle sensor histidine kinase and response regulator CckA